MAGGGVHDMNFARAYRLKHPIVDTNLLTRLYFSVVGLLSIPNNKLARQGE